MYVQLSLVFTTIWITESIFSHHVEDMYRTISEYSKTFYLWEQRITSFVGTILLRGYVVLLISENLRCSINTHSGQLGMFVVLPLFMSSLLWNNSSRETRKLELPQNVRFDRASKRGSRTLIRKGSSATFGLRYISLRYLESCVGFFSWALRFFALQREGNPTE